MYLTENHIVSKMYLFDFSTCHKMCTFMHKLLTLPGLQISKHKWRKYLVKISFSPNICSWFKFHPKVTSITLIMVKIHSYLVKNIRKDISTFGRHFLWKQRRWKSLSKFTSCHFGNIWENKKVYFIQVCLISQSFRLFCLLLFLLTIIRPSQPVQQH